MRILAWFFVVHVVIVAGTTSAADIDFSRDVKPILSNKCYACHGPDRQQREGGDESSGGLHFDTKQGAFADLGGRFAIVPGKPEKSELIRRINSTDSDEVMPPPDHRKQLTANEKKILLDWIKQGANWKDHWAYVAPKRHATPKPRQTQWPRNLIDFFILARLERAGLQPSLEADKRILLRRLSFDLVGLPPRSSDVEAFLADKSAQAYEKAVDRLLASEHYGERMAMHWLDLVRYADTVGYHGDQDVSVSPFRDYVINALNSNMRFDRFTREQLAGDLLDKPTQDQLIASGYNKLGMMSAEGGVQPKEYLAKYASDRVRTAAAIWLGSTVGCSECHDHKFDPFTTKDFYRFAAFFADIKERGLYSGASSSGKWGPRVDVPNANLPELLKPIEQELAQLQKLIDTPTDEITTAQRNWESKISESQTKWLPIRPTSAKALGGTKLKILKDNSILASGASPNQNSYTITAKLPFSGITGFRIEVLPDESLPKKGPGRAGNGNFVITELRVLRNVDSQQVPVTLQNVSATVEQTVGGNQTPYKKWSAASAIDADIKGSNWGWAILPDVGKPNQMVVEAAEVIGKDATTLTFVIEQNHKNPKHTVGRFRISATSTPHPLKATKSTAPPQNIQKILAVATDKRSTAQQTALSAYFRSITPLLAETRKKVADLQKRKQQVTKANTRTTLITVSVTPRTMRVLHRGDWMDESGEVVQPGVPHFLRQIRKKERANRRDLADWITSSDNPLTARVFVNRLWKLYFGTALSKVLDDVGSQGESPTHPQLLDTLAVEFMEGGGGWNIKHIVKLIVMSNTYRQSSLVQPKLAEIDPYNRLLARQSRFRLDAEIIRDNLLAVSGLLVETIGGRSTKPYQPPGLYRHLNFPRRTYKQDNDKNQYRRGLYTHWQRQFLHPAMKAFDAPPREECTADRARSNTPLAALVLLNDPSYVEAARVFAANVILSGGNDTTHRLNWMMQQALSRKPTQDELDILVTLLTAHHEQFKQNPAEAKKLVSTGLTPVPDKIDVAELAAWSSVTRTIFNMHEFITRN